MERRETRRRVLSGSARISALAPFSIRNYRFQWPADLLTSWAFEVENLVLGWYIMTETGSVLLLTVLASLNYAGTLIAPVFGMIGDRIGHRDLLATMRFAYTVLAATIMTLALTGHLAPLNVMIIVAIMGLIRPSDLGVRGALLADIMPPERLVGAISLSRTTMDSARIAGALTGTGLFAAAWHWLCVCGDRLSLSHGRTPDALHAPGQQSLTAWLVTRRMIGPCRPCCAT